MNISKAKLVDVAQRAGVSVTTASQVMRGVGRISETTKDKVLKAASELSYIPNSSAVSMRSGGSKEIGLVIHQIANPFNAEVISGVSDMLEREGYLLSILDARDDVSRQQRHLTSFIKSGRAGLLWVPALGTDKNVSKLLRTHNTPTVTFLRSNGFNEFDHLGVANTSGTRAATEHLLAMGHRQIAYLGGTQMTEVRAARIEGYVGAMNAAGHKRVVIWDCEDNKFAGLEAMIKLKEAHSEVTAVVCNGDMVALGAMLGLDRLGLKAGKDVSIVGFDDIQDAVTSTPELTTLSICPYKLGERLANILLARLHTPDSPVTSYSVSAELVVRGSTSPPV